MTGQGLLDTTRAIPYGSDPARSISIVCLIACPSDITVTDDSKGFFRTAPLNVF